MRTIAHLVALAAVAFIATACGNDNGIVKNVKLKSYNQEGDAYAEVIATLNIGGAQLPSVELPVFDPRNPAVTYGKVSLTPGLGNQADVGIAVNLSDVAHVPGGNALLPNGGKLPVGGIDVTKFVALPLGNTNAQLYVAVDSQLAVIGTAIPIKEFDSVGKVGGGANLFTSFALKNGVRGIAGVFTSARPGQNGFGIFVDASSLLPKPVPQLGLVTTRFALFANSEAPTASKRSISFVNQKPGAYKERKINEHLYKLSAKRKRLTVQ